MRERWTPEVWGHFNRIQQLSPLCIVGGTGRRKTEGRRTGEMGRQGASIWKLKYPLGGIWGSNFISPRLFFILSVFWIREINSVFFVLSVHQTEVCLFTVTENSDKGDLSLSGQLLLPSLWQASCVRQIWTCLIEWAPLSSVSMDAQRICWERSC